MRRTSRASWTVLLLLALAAATCAYGAQPADPQEYDWPQWRGPNRDSVAPGSPKLLDQWPAGGPRLLWKNQSIGSGRDGGASCPVIAGGKVFIYANQYQKGQPGKKLITTEVLTKLGWVEDLPADLDKKIEEACVSAKRKSLKTPQEIETYAQEFIAAVPPNVAEKYGAFIKNRISNKDGRRFRLDELNRLAALRDKDFKTIAEFYEAAEKCVNLADGGDAMLYAAVEDAFGLKDIVYCLDALTGNEIWRQTQAAEGLRNPPIWAEWGASGTPAVSGGCLIVQGSVALYCLSTKDGSLLWKTKTSFSNSSPLILGNVVFAGAEPRQADNVSKDLRQIGGALNAYDLATGKPLWRSKAGASGWGASVIPWNNGGKPALLAIGPVCIDAGNGNVLGEPAKGDGLSCWATPAVAGDIVVARSENTVRAFKIALPKLEKLWESKNRWGEFESASPLIYQGCVYVADHASLRCLDLKTGEQKWLAPKEVDPETSSPLVVDGKLIANVGHNHSKTNETMMLRASPEKCEILGKIAHPATPCTSPAVAGGLLFVRLIDGVACYDLRGQ